MVEGVPIGDKGNISPSQSVPGQDISNQDGAEQTFKDLVNAPKTSKGEKPSPINAAQSAKGGMPTSKPTPENLVANMQMVLGQMKNLGAALNTPNLQMNARTKRLLDAKLRRAKDHIQYVSAKAGVGDQREDQGSNQSKQQKKAEAIEKTGGAKEDHTAAIQKLIGYITDGQAQLESAMHNVSHMKMDKNNPGMMLEHIFGMQVKLYRAQVEVEFSSAVLQKAIDDLKTIMSVQL